MEDCDMRNREKDITTILHHNHHKICWFLASGHTYRSSLTIESLSISSPVLPASKAEEGKGKKGRKEQQQTTTYFVRYNQKSYTGTHHMEAHG